jgi:hypothetical protein
MDWLISWVVAHISWPMIVSPRQAGFQFYTETSSLTIFYFDQETQWPAKDISIASSVISDLPARIDLTMIRR